MGETFKRKTKLIGAKWLKNGDGTLSAYGEENGVQMKQKERR